MEMRKKRELKQAERRAKSEEQRAGLRVTVKRVGLRKEQHDVATVVGNSAFKAGQADMLENYCHFI